MWITIIFRRSSATRVVHDAHTINQALGYEMNTIEFAVKDGIPYAIDFLNPAPDFERDRITEFYFHEVVTQMAKLVIDRALHGTSSNPWPRWEEMLGMGSSRVDSTARLHKPELLGTGKLAQRDEGPADRRERNRGRSCNRSKGADLARRSAARSQRCERRRHFGNRVSGRSLAFASAAPSGVAPRFARTLRDARPQAHLRRPHSLAIPPSILSRPSATKLASGSLPKRLPLLGERVVEAALSRYRAAEPVGSESGGRAVGRDRSRIRAASTASRLDAFLLPDSLQFAEYNARIACGTRLLGNAWRSFRRDAADGAVSGKIFVCPNVPADGFDPRSAAGELPGVGRHGESPRRLPLWIGARFRLGVNSKSCKRDLKSLACRR